ncbi:hypothetical protein GFS31_18890 [Leptolyngbya sp. BL0902]|uniref:DUF1517 domain-containing protein n=1 Tax=Leptolyngbya sp. BL0902 TaxID=1115757 RepID=UPI0018E900D8|nr:DUF1517 domain-containing protein [Leptolyngbya sp. BL0902]QQE65203.1 hypothetical protein GFS31_18890 [Leptolyngbya sp. BL0902]
MLQRLFQRLTLPRVKPLWKPLLALGLAVVLVFGHADGAWAAKAGGRIGGGSFRAPAPRMAPAPTSRAPVGGGGYYPGGGFGFGFPFLFPLFGFGGGFGGLFTLLMVFAIANFLVNSFRRSGDGDDAMPIAASSNPPVTVAKLQVGLLANARSLQDDLNRLALTADTGSTAGLAKLLQETTLSLLRHPDYWVYGASEDTQTRLLSAEQEFNRYTLATRSQLTEETLSNVNSQITQATAKATLPGQADDWATPGEYILATLVVAAQGKLDLPDIRSTDDLRRALGKMGAIASDNLLAVEVLWTPQQSGETLSADEMIAEYPNLKLL